MTHDKQSPKTLTITMKQDKASENPMIKSATKRRSKMAFHRSWSRKVSLLALVYVSLIGAIGIHTANAQTPLEITSGLSEPDHSGYCIDVPSSRTSPKTNIQIYRCHGGHNQQFSVTWSGEIQTHLGPNLCLDVEGGNAYNGANVQLFPCHGGPNQRWTQTHAGELQSAMSHNYCLDVQGGQAFDGANVILYTCHGGWNQRWHLVIHP
jgi:hypothetical protein